MTMAFNGFIGIGQEGETMGTPVTPTEFARFIDADITHDNSAIPLENSGVREEDDMVLGPYICNPSALIEVRPDNIGEILFNLMGLEYPTRQGATSAYSHRFEARDHPRYITWEQAFGKTGHSERVTSVKINETVFEWADRILTANVSGIGQKAEKVSMTTPNFTATQPFMFHQCTVTLAEATAIVKSGRITVNNNVTEDGFGSGSMFRQSCDIGKFEVTTEFELNFAGMEQVQEFWGSASATEPSVTPQYHADKIEFVGPDIVGASPYKYTLTFNLPRHFLEALSAPMHAKDQIIQRIGGRALYKTGDLRSMNIVLINETTAYQ